MSDTPRTDKLFGGFAATDDGYWKVLDHARKLERELAAFRSDNLTAHKMACAAGIERDIIRAELAAKDAGIASMRAQLRDAEKEMLRSDAAAKTTIANMTEALLMLAAALALNKEASK